MFFFFFFFFRGGLDFCCFHVCSAIYHQRHFLKTNTKPVPGSLLKLNVDVSEARKLLLGKYRTVPNIGCSYRLSEVFVSVGEEQHCIAHLSFGFFAKKVSVTIGDDPDVSPHLIALAMLAADEAGA